MDRDRLSLLRSGTEAPEGVIIQDIEVLSGDTSKGGGRPLRESAAPLQGRPAGRGPEGGLSEAGRLGAGASRNPNAASSVLSEIRARIELAKRYPLAARTMEVTGTVRVRFTLDDSGGVASAEVLSSSGSPLLDRAALETVRRAAPFPLYPEPLSIVLRYEL